MSGLLLRRIVAIIDKMNGLVEMKKVLKSFDFPLFIAPILLSLFGVIMVYSASMVVAVMRYDVLPDFFYSRQFQWFWLSLIVYITFTFIPYRNYLKLIKLIFFGSLFLLIFVLIKGEIGGNAQSWINLFGINFQPAEFVKLGLIIYLAAVFSRKLSYIENFWLAFGPPLIFTMFIFVLIFLQPDLGTGLIILAISFVMIACAGLRLKHFIAITLTGIIGLFIMFPFLSEEQLSRFSAAYDPFQEGIASKGGYQLINSYLAIASGGLIGQGLGESIQKYGYLPEPHTDFIMAVIAEELGIFGVSFVLFMLLFIVVKGFRLAMKSKDSYAGLLAIGISSMIGIQAVVNLGAITGLLPITGVPLPFISYGGSSLLLLMVSMGILNNIAIKVNLQKKSTHHQKVNHQSNYFTT